MLVVHGDSALSDCLIECWLDKTGRSELNSNDRSSTGYLPSLLRSYVRAHFPSVHPIYPSIAVYMRTPQDREDKP